MQSKRIHFVIQFERNGFNIIKINSKCVQILARTMQQHSRSNTFLLLIQLFNYLEVESLVVVAVGAGVVLQCRSVSQDDTKFSAHPLWIAF